MERYARHLTISRGILSTVMSDLWKVAAPVSAVLTLATWLLFRYSDITSSIPLSKKETTFVFAFWFAIVAIVRLVSRRRRRRRK
jgi:hypothetical protein